MLLSFYVLLILCDPYSFHHPLSPSYSILEFPFITKLSPKSMKTNLLAQKMREKIHFISVLTKTEDVNQPLLTVATTIFLYHIWAKDWGIAPRHYFLPPPPLYNT
ncbi:hypothetical protein POVWA2_075760 [Plasmodium ovale wallikeri]|uniref:Uncharacterized protein n=1 Tax=Plasmodium ovale wallikeri TaxID=864142 RepID=A0A1A8YMD2_PLAOA|nr:hypothetical protein POVWA1_012530 [Plasmodium ovale wallikeri]SBT56864.1 hypothetical protein POVWA2_075760 [Plasmodium ovale wallikeri]